MEGDSILPGDSQAMNHFNPLPPHGGRRRFVCRMIDSRMYFNPLPPHGGRLASAFVDLTNGVFQSTPSAWRETPVTGTTAPYTSEFQSTPSAWRETSFSSRDSTRLHLISIHSLRMEGDDNRQSLSHAPAYFNPLPPHGGRLTTRPAFPRFIIYFNPLPPHGGRLQPCTADVTALVFQSTPSAWRETAKLHRKAFFISPILVQSCKKGCKRLHSAPEKMVFFEKREKNLVRNLQHLSVRL